MDNFTLNLKLANIEANNPQIEICWPRSSLTEFKSGIKTLFGDDLKRRDQYKPGVVEG